jgi:hypothetical protein
LPWEEKERVKTLYKEYVQWLKDNGANESTVNAVWGIVEYMCSADHTKLIPEFQKQIITIDFIRNENFDEIFTELKNL